MNTDILKEYLRWCNKFDVEISWEGLIKFKRDYERWNNEVYKEHTGRL